MATLRENEKRRDGIEEPSGRETMEREREREKGGGVYRVFWFKAAAVPTTELSSTHAPHHFVPSSS